jgi:hypothetical protein
MSHVAVRWGAGLLLALAGCTMCRSPYDDCSPVHLVSGDARAGSVLSGQAGVSPQPAEPEPLAEVGQSGELGEGNELAAAERAEEAAPVEDEVSVATPDEKPAVSQTAAPTTLETTGWKPAHFFKSVQPSDPEP